MDSKRLGNREIVLGLKSNCVYDEKVVKDDKNLGNLPEGVSNGSSHENELKEAVSNGSSLENETKELSQTPGQSTRETVLGLKSKSAYDEKVVKNDENVWNLTEGASNGSRLENGTKELSQTPGQRKRSVSRRKENMATASSRVLRSRSQEKPKVLESTDAPSQVAESKEKKKRKMKKTQKDNNNNNEFSKIKTHLRYLFGRMKYEQNFIDAYAGEGWKGQSLEKIRPEKELERAKSDIHRYKLKIRDLFKRIDTSCEEGRIPESLFDSEGEIDSEDIFCAKCGQTEVQLDNDIILCDGACERGFHQYCLDPPLLKEQVPAGDEGWLCPACDCKVDCLDLFNDSMGTDLSIEDSWEKVFPETAASGNTLNDNLGIPSDDSEDDDYDPDGPQVEEDGCNPEGPHEDEDDIDAEDSSSDESDFSSASEDLRDFAKHEEFLGLPSEDSEDDDFNPDGPDLDEEAKKESSSSDFTSDSEDLGDIRNEVTSDEIHGPVLSQDEEKFTEGHKENDDFGPITAKRKGERLDYKKLHDEAYGNVSSDSSDEDFYDFEGPSKQKKTEGAKDRKSNKKQKQTESAPISKKLDVEDTSSSPAHKGSSDKNGNTLSPFKRFGEAVTQRLNEAFNENHYPDRGVRENLVKELNLTHTQVSKWFEKARWRLNHPEGRGKSVKLPRQPAEKLVSEQAHKFTGFPSEDSQDVDDFNPDKSDSDEEDIKDSSSSDFTSDSEDLGDIKNELMSDEVQGAVISQDRDKLTKGNRENDDFGPITAKRKVERLDYKKLHDEAYGNVSSDSSDKDFFDSEALSKRKNTEEAKDMKSNKKQKHSEATPVSKKLDVEDTRSSPAYKHSSENNGNRLSKYKRIGEAAARRLNEAFKENRYPDPGARENLAKELNLTHSQVSKWFENARWKFNHPEGRSKSVKSPLESAEKLVSKQENEVISTAPTSRKRKTDAAEASQTDSSNQTIRRRGRVQAKRS